MSKIGGAARVFSARGTMSHLTHRCTHTHTFLLDLPPYNSTLDNNGRETLEVNTTAPRIAS